MDDGAFAALLGAIDAQAFSEDKINVIAQASQGNWVRVGQLKQIVQRLAFSADQVRAVELFAPRVLDKQNAFALYDAFSFSSDKDRVREILSR